MTASGMSLRRLLAYGAVSDAPVPGNITCRPRMRPWLNVSTLVTFAACRLLRPYSSLSGCVTFGGANRSSTGICRRPAAAATGPPRSASSPRRGALHDPCHQRGRRDREACGRIDIGGLAFLVDFVGVGNHWEIHWGYTEETYDILRAYGERAGVFQNVVICMRDMIGDLR
jgi:hypothetical protein